MTKKNAQKCPEGNTKSSGHTASRVRHYPSFTFYPYDASNNFTDEKPIFDANTTKYLIYGKEICPETKRIHYQGEVYFFEKVSISTAQRYLGIGKAHMENFLKTDAIACNEYCKKDGLFEEFGIPPNQGRRTDLDALKDDLLSDKICVEDIIVNAPIMYHQYGRTLDKIEDIKLRKKYRTEMTKGIWYYGKTGVGKSHKAFEEYSPDTHYPVPDDNGWWDGYRQQDCVILNDFRGRISYNELLQMVDKWPFQVKRRGREPMPFTSKLVIITSSLRPEEVYHNRNAEDSMEQFYRRFEVIEL